MHYVYRHYDKDGALLYVGCTHEWTNRTMDHRKFSKWWSAVVRLEIERFADKSDALKAEKKAIENENPSCNVTHNRVRKSVAREEASPAAKP